MFQKWDYVRVFKGKDNDWVNCVPGCTYHDYSQKAIEFLTKSNLVADKSIFSTAAARNHSVCRVVCELHKGTNLHQPSVVGGGSPSRRAQHFLDKLVNAKQTQNLALHVYLQAGWAQVNICLIQNKDPTKGPNMSAYSSPQIHKAPSISLSGSQSPAPTFPSTVSEFNPIHSYNRYQQQGIVLNQYDHCNFTPNYIHFQNESIDTFRSQEDKTIETIYRGRNKIKRRLRAYICTFLWISSSAAASSLSSSSFASHIQSFVRYIGTASCNLYQNSKYKRKTPD